MYELYGRPTAPNGGVRRKGEREGKITNVTHRGGDVGSILGRRLKGKGRQCLYKVNAVLGIGPLTVCGSIQEFSLGETEIRIILQRDKIQESK
ncbi:unnamed protein product [Lasius platythorax]|uniref:Uncharacterized protein n=1 Tax=Lasius platythorax TaxID=488582 RepID=A0AAV2PB62_9HYME